MTNRTRRAAVAAVAGLLLGAQIGAAGAEDREPDTHARKLVAQDEFTGNRLDTSKWSPYDAKSSNGISQWTPDEIGVGGGELRINGHGKDPSGKGNRSGALCWCRGAGDQAYGLWMVRARFDAGKGYGVAMLLWPQSNHWPEDGELDMVESARPERNTALASVHWGSLPNGQRDSGKLWGDYTQWHTYAVDWQPGFVKYSIDGQTVYDTRYSTKNPGIPKNPMHLVIQQEPGPFGAPGWIPAPDESTPDQVTTHVDWVRMYE
ncbi:glycoside hydrolase family 16 protein [Amycolatopsis jiangsuensis]|uniref:Beta-glucanase (GH16 family) n=1 Tax=Amycolatopsis jiangsuensis TaxID=1181879 RepID=A0A840IPY0_9PSEU|nr:glycoside hydrolase family 16 protein [Amycolatopsis jiangsuensis]MBB4684446.1 beta-glucanase (GH16 family) [Amycolatopsis jiangsuensis]